MFPFAVAQSSSTEPSTKPSEAASAFARAPKLRESGELAVTAIVKGLQTMGGRSTIVDGMLASLKSSTPRDVIAAHRPDSVIGSITLKDLSCMLLVALDGTLVYAMVELFCGGNGAEPQAKEPRAVTAIDQQFAHTVFALVASAIEAEWSGFGFSAAQATKIEGLLSADIFGARVDEVGVLDLTIGIFGLHGTLRVVLPPAALDRFAVDPMDASGDASGDPHWTVQLRKEIGRASVSLSAYLDAKDIPLGSLAGLRVGQILPLSQDARTRASLVSDGSVLYRGEIGRDETNYSMRIDELVAAPSKSARSAAGTRRPPSIAQSKG